MPNRLIAVLLGTALLPAAPAGAHHSYAATYDVSKTVTLEGRLLRIELRSPHSFVHIQAPDEDGTPRRWAVEWSASGLLNRQGVTRDTLRSGDEVILTVNPSRVGGELRGLMVTLERPSDGMTWGTDPDEVVE